MACWQERVPGSGKPIKDRAAAQAGAHSSHPGTHQAMAVPPKTSSIPSQSQGAAEHVGASRTAVTDVLWAEEQKYPPRHTSTRKAMGDDSWVTSDLF